MEIYREITKFLKENGKCLIIEDGKLAGVVLTMEEYEKLKDKPEVPNQKPEIIEPKMNIEKNLESNTINPVGDAMVNEIEFPEDSADLDEINLSEDITLKDLGLDELPY